MCVWGSPWQGLYPGGDANSFSDEGTWPEHTDLVSAGTKPREGKAILQGLEGSPTEPLSQVSGP